MNYQFYPHIQLDLWAYRDNNPLLGRQENDDVISFVFIDITQVAPKETVDRYGMEIINHTHLMLIGGHYYRHVLIYSTPDQQCVETFLKNLVYRCAKLGPIWETILGYAEHEDSPWFYPADDMLGQVIVGHEPSISWSIESGRDLEGLSEAFDERIIATILWKNKNGIEVIFKGYWYAVSRAYSEERLKINDPYYRRYLYIPEVFRSKILEACFNNMLRDFACVPLCNRFFYLMRHFEYDGQPMLYGR